MSLCSGLILFGATSDLAARMLFPSLYHLDRDGLLPPGLKILATSRTEHDDTEFRQMVADGLKRSVAGEFVQKDVDQLLARITYRAADIGTDGGMDRLAEALKGFNISSWLVYLSTGSNLYGPIAQALAETGQITPDWRIVLEKPIGHDLASSAEVNASVLKVFNEEQIFRVDHYLGKEGVQNLIALRFANTLFEAIWNQHGIDHVQITVAEEVGCGGRGAYYDGVGALRDMVQNHVLQLVALVAMEPPAKFDADAVRDEKIKLLRSLRPIGPTEVAAKSVLGQYGPGMSGGAMVPGYLTDLGLDRSDTETFVALRVDIDNWRWAGVPFYLRTGKRMAERRTEIAVQFRPVPHSIFNDRKSPVVPNRLLISLQPEESITLSVMNKVPGLSTVGMDLKPLDLNLSLSNAFGKERRRIAYERLILDALNGNPTLFVRRDEVAAAWRWIDGISEGWQAAGLVPKSYSAGSWGPSSAIALPERFGHSWHE